MKFLFLSLICLAKLLPLAAQHAAVDEAVETAAWAEEGDQLAPLTRQEAEILVADEMNLAKQREKERLAQIKADPASHVATHAQGARRVIMRRVASKPWTAKPHIEISDGTAAWTEEQLAEWRDTHRAFRTIILSATVFDRKISELVWRRGDVEFTVLSNVDFNYLTMVGGFESGRTHWSAFFFVDNVDSEEEERFARLAAKNGWEHLPRTSPDEALFQSDKPDYLIYAENEAEVPLELTEELDALHQHYEANEEKLKIAWQRQQALNEARRAWMEANPPKPRDTIINFWPVRRGTRGKN